MKKLFLVLMLILSLTVCFVACESETGTETDSEIGGGSNTESESETVSKEESIDPNMTFEFDESESAYILKSYTGDAEEVIVPSTYKGYPVTTIGDKAFAGCKSITSVIVSDGITTIKDQAFYNCDQLKSIVLAPSAKSIAPSAFDGCTADYVECHLSVAIAMSKLDPLHLAVSGDILWNRYFDAYLGVRLETLELKEGFKIIKSSSLRLPKSVINLSIPSTVTTIENEAIDKKYCTHYEGGYYIGNADNPYHALIEVWSKGVSFFYVHEDTKVIADRAFSRSGPPSIYIPASVTHIGKNAFADCTRLKELHITDISAWCQIEFNYNESQLGPSNPLFFVEKFYVNGESVTDLVIPAGTPEIKAGVLATPYGLFTSVYIPASVEKIGALAFNRGIDFDPFIIYCEAESAPSGWEPQWAVGSTEVVWGYALEE